MAVNKRKILEAAQKFLQKGALDKALREYRTLLDLDPRDSGARLKLGDIHLRLGEKDDAVAAYLKVAHQFMKDGFDAKAVALFKQIAKLAPEHIEVHVPLAELYQRLGLTPEAMSALQTAVEAFQKAGRKREALELLRKAAALDPTNTTSRLKIADLLRAQGMDAEALNEYEEVAAELERSGETGGLAGVYERMLEIEPDRVPALVALSRLSLRESAPERALELAERAAGLRPDLMEAVQLHAESLQAVGRPTEEQEPVWRRLAELHLSRGDEAEGRAILQRFCSSYDLTQSGVDLGNAQGEGLALAPEGRTSPPGEITEAGRQLGERLPPADDLLLDPPAATGLAAPAEAALAEPDAAAGAPDEAHGPSGSAEPVPKPLDAGTDADIEQLLAEAGVYLRFGKRERAIASLEAVLLRAPAHPSALEKLAGAVAQEGDLQRATSLLTAGIAALEAEGDADAAARLRSCLAEIDPGAEASFETLSLADPGAPALVELDAGLHAAGDGDSGTLPEEESAGSMAAAPQLAPAEPPQLAPAEPPQLVPADPQESPFELEVELDFSDATHDAPELEAGRVTSAAAEPAGSLLLDSEPEGTLLLDGEPAEASPGSAPQEPEIAADAIGIELEEAPTESREAFTEELVLELPTEFGSAEGTPAEAAGETTARSLGDGHGPAGELVLEDELRLEDEIPSREEAFPREESGAPSLSSSPTQILEDLEEGDFYFQQQLLDEAEAVYRRVLEAAPTNPQALLRLGEIAAARGEDPAGTQPGTAGTDEPGEDALAAEAPAGNAEPSFGDDLAEWDEQTMAVAESPADPALTAALEDEPVAAPAPDAAESGEESDEDPAAGTEPVREISHFDLAAELSLDLAAEGAGPQADAAEESAADSRPSLSPEAEPSLETIFSEFKRGVQKTLTAADHETHYDLGIAYREMGLYEDAMSEFRIALESPARRVDCLQLLGLCARDLKRPQDAVAFLRQALSDEGLEGERRFATLFDLALALEEAGETAEALVTLERLRDAAPDHPGLVERMEALRALQTLSPTEARDEASTESGEVFESFDDLIADAEAAFAAGTPPAKKSSAGSEGPEPPPDRPSPATPRGTPPRRRKISFG